MFVSMQDVTVLQGAKRLQDNMQEVQETGRSCMVMCTKTVQVLVHYFCLG